MVVHTNAKLVFEVITLTPKRRVDESRATVVHIFTLGRAIPFWLDNTLHSERDVRFCTRRFE